MTKASIIIPSYNSASFLTETINSILNQGVKDLEILIIDDGSTDNTQEIVQTFPKETVRYIYQTNSGGPAKPRNIGINESQGEYIFIFDSDDIMLPNKISETIKALDTNPDAIAAFSNFQTIDDEGKILNEDFLKEYDTLLSLIPENSNKSYHQISPSTLFERLIKVNFIGTSSIALRSSLVKGNYTFDERMLNSDDRLMWITLAKKHPFVFINQKLHQYRIRENSISQLGFLRRAPSKILGLQQILELCDAAKQRAIVKKQLQRDFLTLAYAYRLKKEFRRAHSAVVSSLRYGVTFKSIQTFLGIYKEILKSFSHCTSV